MLAEIMAAIDMTTDAVAVLLIGNPAMLSDAHDDVTAIGGRVLATLDWVDTGVDTPALGARPIMLIEAREVDDDLLAATLPALNARALALDLPVVVNLAEASIDVVAAAMLGPRTQLLCDATATERSAALVFAAERLGHAGFHERSRESEAARLQRLNAEVARIAEVLSRISAREAGVGRPSSPEVSGRALEYDQEPMGHVVIEPGEIRHAIRARRLRDRFFGKGMFEEPGWDIVLDLFAAELEQVRVSVSSLCIAAAVAPTTALRWVSKLTEAGLLVRQPDPFDRRRAYMELSERASRAMRDYMAAMRRAGLSLA